MRFRGTTTRCGRECRHGAARRAVALCVVFAWGISAGGASAQDFVLSEEQFNAWITNGQDSALTRIENQLTLQLRGLTRTCDLSPDQVDKLRLAARGDIERYHARVTEVHDRLVGKAYDQNRINELWQEIQPLQQELPKVLGPGSLFSKVMRRTLRESQREEYDRVLAERSQYRYEAKVRLFVSALDRAAPLTADQRNGLTDLILAKTRRPQRFGQYDFYYVQVHAAKVSDDAYAEVLERAQVKALRQALQQARGYEQILENEGCVPMVADDPPANDDKDALLEGNDPAIDPAEAGGT